SRRPFRTWAASSSARTPASDPPRRPIGDRTASTRKASDTFDSIDSPGFRNAFEHVLSALAEGDSRARDEILDRARDEHLAAARERRDPRTDMRGDPGDRRAEHLALAGVQPGPDIEPELAHGIAYGACAADRSAGPSKVARKPSPAVSTSEPRQRSSSRLTSAW